MKTVLEAVLYLLQHGESCHPSPLLQAGPVQPVHQCTDTSSVVVKRELHIKFCLILIYGGKENYMCIEVYGTQMYKRVV